MDIRSIIDQLCTKDIDYSIESLHPIDGVYKDLPVIKKSKYEFMVSMESDGNGYDDINLSVIDSKELLSKLKELGEVKFIQYLNREIFDHIQSKVQSAIKQDLWGETNRWHKPMSRFDKWFDDNNIDPGIDILKREETNDALWAIADDMRSRKDNGEFDTYMDAYRWAEKHFYKKGVIIKATKLKSAYNKAKSQGRV